MRKLTLDEIDQRVRKKEKAVDYAANKFRSKSKEDGWIKGRVRPRERDEVIALNRLARMKIKEALKSGKVQYDRERRVFSVDEFS